MFLPNEAVFYAALEQDAELIEKGVEQKVILATPTSFIALLRAVAYGWRQQALTENAEKIREVGEELYGRLGTFAEHLTRLGKSLDSSVGHFNSAVGSFDSRILPGARKFTEMGIHSKKELEEAQPIEKSVRAIQSDSEEKVKK